MRSVLSGTLLLILVATSVGTSAIARDRPGTPNNVEIRDCQEAGGPASFCGVYSDTAQEPSKIEFEVTENGHAAPKAVLVGCPLHPKNDGKNPACIVQQTRYGDGEFQVRGASFSAKYCIRLRARRLSDQVVSEVWSAPACFFTPPAPKPPAAPNIQVAYQGGTWSAGQKPMPNAVAVSLPSLDKYSTAYLTYNNESNVYPITDLRHWTRHVNPGDDLLTIKVCVKNAAGQNCGTRQVSVVKQQDVSVNGKTIRVTGAPHK